MINRLPDQTGITGSLLCLSTRNPHIYPSTPNSFTHTHYRTIRHCYPSELHRHHGQISTASGNRTTGQWQLIQAG